MKAERWHQIEEAFHGALQREGTERESYLIQVCDGDQELFNEIQTLIACYELPGEFLEKSQLTIGMNILTRHFELSKNEAVGPYVIERKIGSGGMGDIYLARDLRLGRYAALKLLPQSFENNADWVARFQQEARAASSIAHPNVAHIYEVGEFQGRHYIAMEYIDGVTLRAYLNNNGRLKPTETIDIITQSARALMAAHQAGVLHRDIKPDNIMLHRDGYVKVLDFGLAKSIVPFKSADTGEGLVRTIETDAGIIVGSPAYMSPEQARGQKVDPRSDLWSLGVVFYELLTAHNPFLSDTPTDTIAAILKSEPPPLGLLPPGRADKMELIIASLLAKKVGDRYPDAESLINDLQKLTEELNYQKTLEHPLSESDAGSGVAVEKTSAKRSNKLRDSITSVPAQVVSVIKPTKLRVSALVLLIVTVLLVFRYTSLFTNATSVTPTPITSVAVLPFVNGNGDANSQYISDGLSEALIERLSRLPRLKVIARSSSFKYREKTPQLNQIARDLGVQAVISGTISKQGEDVFVNVELRDANQTTRLWSQEYRYKTSEIPIVLNDIGRKIASNLNLNLTSKDLNLLTRGHKEEGDAYDWYLKGRFYWNQLTEEGLDKSIECFNQALTIDPEYPLAYTGLANSYITLGAAYRSSEDIFVKAELNAQKALNLDGDLAEGHYAMAVTHYIYRWDLSEAEKELKYSLNQNPNFAMAYSLLSSVSLARGDLDQAIAYINRALELDPFSLLFNSRLSYIYYCKRDGEKQLKLIQDFLNREPGASILYNDMAIAYAQLGRFDEALAASQRAMVLMGQDSDTLSTLGIVYALSGKKAEAKWVAEKLKELSNKKYVPPFLIASTYSALGDTEQAFSWLEKAVQQHDSYLLRIRVESVLEPLRSDVRYERLLQSLSLN